MRKKLLIDAGPIIALFDKTDAFHLRALHYFEQLKERPVTTWPVITEVSHMLDFHVLAQTGFLKWINRDGLEIFDLKTEDLPGIIELTQKYSNVPMDLADASLIVASEHLNTNRILFVDSDFNIFRNRFKNMLVNEFVVL